MDFVSESTKEELLRLEHEFNETKKSLAKLEKQYIGHTLAQQETLNKLKQMDMYYQAQVKTLEAKLVYIHAAYRETAYLADKEQARGEKCYYDALLDMMD